MLQIRLRAYLIALLLLVFLAGMVFSGWLITTLGVLSFIGSVIILVNHFVEDEDMSLEEFIFGIEH